MPSSKFDCIFLDFDERQKASAAIERIRRDKINRYAIIFALSHTEAGGQEPAAGVSYVVSRSADFHTELKSSFLTARSLILGEKRRYQRHPVDLKASCACGDRITQTRIIDLSERGACLEFTFPMLIPMLELSFALPGIEGKIQAEVKVVWREERKAGVQFVGISETCKTALRDWLSNRVAFA
jgi:hypothetical protein